MRQRSLHHVLNLSVLARLGIALFISTLCWWLAPAEFQPGTRLIAAWDGFCVAILVLTWVTITTADAAHIRRVATSEDPGRTWTFVAVLVAASASLFAVALLLKGIKTMQPTQQLAHVLVSVVAVLGSWLLLHTLFTLRYAHVYYSEDRATSPPDKLGGLEFPGAPPTTYWDFAYFAFVIGMTAQTSDTGVTSLRMRQLTLVHGILSFAFNTAVIALSVNVISSIL
ncbi:MAG: DUF1345 domain-containing protein [Hymenobacter sp.]